jgi:uncharacterized protein
MSMVRFLFLSMVLLLTTLASACSGGGDYVLPPKQTPALWLVEDLKSSGRAYVFGSVHMLPHGLDWITPRIRAAAADSDILITEIGGDAAPSGLFDVMASDEAVLPLQRRLQEQALVRAEILAAGAGLSEDDLDTTESWAAAIILTQAQSSDLAVTAEYGVETRLRELMTGKSVIGLETAQVQFERFDNLPHDAQDTMLRLSLRSSDTRAEFQAMLTAWLTGDLAAMEAQLADGMMANTELRAELLHRPNTLWANQIATRLTAGNRAFVAIGTAHLLGKHSVLAQLSAKGMRVTRVQ